MNEDFKNLESPDEIKLLKYPDNIRQRIGMYLSGNDSTDTLLREIIDNATDECQHTADTIVIDRNCNGFVLVADNGRGIPIQPAAEPLNGVTVTQAELSICTLHSGSKFTDNKSATIGQNGVGSAAVNAVSEDYILLSHITPLNYDKSTEDVFKLWESSGPRSKKDLFYVIWYKKGYKYFEGAAKKSDIEKTLFGKKFDKELPTGMSTIVLFKPDPEIFSPEAMKMNIPVQNLQYFLLIQEKFYKKKVNINVEGTIMNASGFNGYDFEIMKRLIPADTSMNEYIDVYISFSGDKALSSKESYGSVNGLTVDSGVHVSYVEDCFAKALKETYGIKHRYITTGLKLVVVALASETVFSSQTKEKLKAFAKVKPSDFDPLIKEFQKIFRKNPEYWQEYVDSLNYLADSMRNLGAAEKADKIMQEAAGRNMYKNKADMVEGFSDATAGPSERWNCELFMCFTGDTEVLTCNEERIKFTDLVERLNSGENIYTFSCTSGGEIKPAKILAASKIHTADKLAKITLDNGEVIKCTLDHKFLLRDGTYKEAKDLVGGDSMMPCYMRTVEDSNNEPEYHGKIFKRRVVVSNRVSGEKYGRPYKAVDRQRNEYYVYRIMATHSDVNYHETYKSEKLFTRHHMDFNPLNDYPTNLLWCGRNWHRGYHGSVASRQAALEDPEKYKRMYGPGRLGEESRRKHDEKINAFYKSEKGEEMKNHLREKALSEWDNEELRKWRSEETRRYAAEHPEWVAENTKKARFVKLERHVTEVSKILEENGLEKTSYNYNKVVFDNKQQGNFDARFSIFQTIAEEFPDLIKDFQKVENDTITFIRTEKILESLKEKKLEITKDNFNSEIKKVYGNVGGGKGFDASMKVVPELIKKYQAELNRNHKIVSVELISLETPEDVYCLEVDTEEHNFPLAAGIFAKNCEGLSPSGSLKAARPSTKYLATLPLRGRSKNVKDSTADDVLNNKEFYTIFRVIGLGIDVNNVTSGCKSPEEAYEKIKKFSRYGKIVIATDKQKCPRY